MLIDIMPLIFEMPPICEIIIDMLWLMNIIMIIVI